MKTFYLLLLTGSITLLLSCTHRTTSILSPASSRVAYKDGLYISDQVSPKQNFRIETANILRNNNQLVFDIKIFNISENDITIDPTTFNYQLPGDLIKYYSINPDDVLYDLDRKIDDTHGDIKINRTIGIFETLLTIGEVLTATTDEEAAAAENSYQLTQDINQESEIANLEHIVTLQDARIHYQNALMRTATISENEYYQGQVIFPMTKTVNKKLLGLSLYIGAEDDYLRVSFRK